MKVKIFIKALAIKTISIPNQDERNIQTKGFPFKHIRSFPFQQQEKLMF